MLCFSGCLDLGGEEASLSVTSGLVNFPHLSQAANPERFGIAGGYSRSGILGNESLTGEEAGPWSAHQASSAEMYSVCFLGAAGKGHQPNWPWHLL